MKCDNCGKTKCDCPKYQGELEQMSSRYVPMSREEKRRRALETARRLREWLARKQAEKAQE